jgi:hypothetical protein
VCFLGYGHIESGSDRIRGQLIAAVGTLKLTGKAAAVSNFARNNNFFPRQRMGPFLAGGKYFL